MADPPDAGAGGRRRLGFVLLGLGALLVVGAVVLALVRHSGGSDSPRPSSRVAGFGAVTIDVDDDSFCVLLASTAEQREQGLMHRTDLAGYAGMLFDFGGTVNDRFWMKDTPLPLSVAFFRSDGRLVSTDDMAPCLTLGNGCPTYGATAPYRWALEVPQGRLSGMGIGAGSRLAVRSGRSCHTPLSD